MAMKLPPHPGQLIKFDVLEHLGVSVTEAAQRLGVSRVALSRVLNGRAAISSDLAVRFEAAGVSTARLWLEMQAAYELAQTRLKKKPNVMLLQSISQIAA